MYDVKDNIRKIRESKGFSQDELCIHLNKTQSAYARLELGKTKIDLEFLQEFANYFKMDLVDVITYPVKTDKSESNIEAIIQIKLSSEKKNKMLELLFGDKSIEIL
jgi:transcriptional regulator with XRE-family HTH domain